MGALFNDLIQVTALESGHLDLTPTQVDLLRCVEDAVNQVGPALREKDVALRMDFPQVVPTIMGDNDAVSQIILHLLNNAIAASPEGDQVVLAGRVEQSEDHGFLMLSVTDHGEGIPVEDLGRVFQRLYRGDRVIIQGVGDGGIGLSLVKALSEALGGRVWVESEVGAGSTFTVLLPLTESKPEADGQGQPGEA
jgi:histidine kinase